MAIHSSTIAWKIPWTEEPGRLQSMISKSRTRLSDFTFFHFPVFLPKQLHGQRSLAGYSPWGCKELDMANTFLGLPGG